MQINFKSVFLKAGDQFQKVIWLAHIELITRRSSHLRTSAFLPYRESLTEASFKVLNLESSGHIGRRISLSSEIGRKIKDKGAATGSAIGRIGLCGDRLWYRNDIIFQSVSTHP